MNREIHALTQRLDHVITLADRLGSDDELCAQYARYICVLVSGYVEEALRVLLLSYASVRCGPELARFVQLKTQDLTNLKFAKLLSVLEMFSLAWRNDFETRVGENAKDALNSVVANRHLIAHGKTTNISLARVKQYYALIKPAVTVLEEHIIA